MTAISDITPYKVGICAAIWREFGRMKGGAKLAARAANVSERSTENWFAEKNAPNGEQLLELMASSDAIADEVLRLVAERRRAREDKCRG